MNPRAYAMAIALLSVFISEFAALEQQGNLEPGQKEAAPWYQKVLAKVRLVPNSTSLPPLMLRVNETAATIVSLAVFQGLPLDIPLCEGSELPALAPTEAARHPVHKATRVRTATAVPVPQPAFTTACRRPSKTLRLPHPLPRPAIASPRHVYPPVLATVPPPAPPMPPPPPPSIRPIPDSARGPIVMLQRGESPCCQSILPRARIVLDSRTQTALKALAANGTLAADVGLGVLHESPEASVIRACKGMPSSRGSLKDDTGLTENATRPNQHPHLLRWYIIIPLATTSAVLGVFLTMKSGVIIRKDSSSERDEPLTDVPAQQTAANVHAQETGVSCIGLPRQLCQTTLSSCATPLCPGACEQDPQFYYLTYYESWIRQLSWNSGAFYRFSPLVHGCTIYESHATWLQLSMADINVMLASAEGDVLLRKAQIEQLAQLQRLNGFTSTVADRPDDAVLLLAWMVGKAHALQLAKKFCEDDLKKLLYELDAAAHCANELQEFLRLRETQLLPTLHKATAHMAQITSLRSVLSSGTALEGIVRARLQRELQGLESCRKTIKVYEEEQQWGRAAIAERCAYYEGTAGKVQEQNLQIQAVTAALEQQSVAYEAQRAAAGREDIEHYLPFQLAAANARVDATRSSLRGYEAELRNTLDMYESFKDSLESAQNEIAAGEEKAACLGTLFPDLAQPA